MLMAPQALGSKNDVDHCFESAVNSYIHKARSPFFGSRATLLCYELFKQRNMYRESPVTLTRMTAEVAISAARNRVDAKGIVETPLLTKHLLSSYHNLWPKGF